MSGIFLNPTEPTRPAKGLRPFALGFRPFFILAGASAVILIGLWLYIWSVGSQGTSYYGPVGWHSHEMLFGYTAAVIAGFLLTAVRNWTGIDTPTGPPLAALAGLWLLGRLAPLAYPLVPDWLIALVDLAFLPALVVALYRPLMGGRQKINRMFLPLLGAMALANLLVHLQSLGLSEAGVRGQGFMINLVILLMAIVGGRVMPFFTEKAVMGSRPKTNLRLEQASFSVLLLLIAVELLWPVKPLISILALGVAFTQGWRLLGWHDPRVWQIPILWVLYTGFGWLVFGFILKAAAAMDLVGANLATHALTVGAIGVLTLGMMARVSLGHTGRLMQSHRLINLAFVLINLGAAVRVILPVFLPAWYQHLLHLAGGLWVLGFAVFAVIYIPILLAPRVDGQPG